MSPARRPAGGKGKRRSSRRRPLLTAAIALLVLVGAGAAGLAIYFGFLPGPGSRLAQRGTQALPDDSTLAASVSGGTTVSAAPETTATATPASQATATVVTPLDSAAGDAVYHGPGKCVGCHGAAGEGVAGLGPSLRDSVGRLQDGSVAGIARIVTAGASVAPGSRFPVAMPSYATQLSPDDVARVAGYVFALGHPGRLVPDSVRNAGTPAAADAAGGAVNADAPIAGAAAPAVRGSTTTAPAPIRPTVPAPSPTPAGPPRRP